MQTAVVTLLIVTSSVLLACAVVNYTVSIMEQRLQNSNIPQIDGIKAIEASTNNETNNLLNHTIQQLQNQTNTQQFNQTNSMLP